MSDVGDIAKGIGASGVLATLGPWGVIAGLALQFGTDFVKGLLENAKNGVEPTPEEWDKLVQKIKTPFEDL